MTTALTMTFAEMNSLAHAIAKSGLFGMDTHEKALALMAIAQAEGYSPALAARDYHIIKGRPTLKADAMLTRFHQAGGRVEWHEYTDDKVCGTFSHDQGGTVTVDWDMQRAGRAELLGNTTWRKYPRNMLRSRVISEAIRTVYPGVSVGMYTPEEIEDITPSDDKRSATLKGMATAKKKLSLREKLGIEERSLPAEAIDLEITQLDSLKVLVDACDSIEALEKVGQLAKSLPDEQKEELRSIYQEKKELLKTEVVP